MRFLSRIVILFLIICLSNCSRLNRDAVEVMVSSDPPGADIYIDDKLYGQTPKLIEVVPDKDYQLIMKKSGYMSKGLTMQSEYSFRKGARYDTPDSGRCILDYIGSFWVVPYFSFRSVKCRNFTQNKYLLNLDEAPHQTTNSQNMINTPSILPLPPQIIAPPAESKSAPTQGESSYALYPDNKKERPKDYYEWE